MNKSRRQRVPLWLPASPSLRSEARGPQALTPGASPATMEVAPKPGASWAVASLLGFGAVKNEIFLYYIL